MFSKNPTMVTTIEMGFFASEITIKDSITNRDDILSQVDVVMDFIKKHMNKEIVITANKQNTERWQYPLEAIRELVLNMIIHRDYTSTADSQVKIFPNSITLYNPGELPANITIDQLLTNDYVSYPRNRQIAQVVKELGWIEKYGTGIKRVIEMCKTHHIPIPIFKTLQSGIYITIYDQSNHKDLEKDLEKDQLTQNQVAILKEISNNNKITQKELSHKVGINEKNIRNNINLLKAKGKLKRIGPDKGGYWEIIVES